MPAKKAAKKAAAKKAAPAAKTAPAKKAAKKTARKSTDPAAVAPAESAPVTDVATAAYLNYLARQQQGLPPDPIADWLEAEKSTDA